jgi:hypothetical protein
MLPQQLNDEALLLLYLADELPAERRAQFERRLASDAGLRRQLETLGGAYEVVGNAIRTADRSERIALSAATAAQRVGQHARSWQARRLAGSVVESDRRRPVRALRRAYLATAAAAAIVAGVTLWHGLQSRSTTTYAERPAPGSPSIWRSPAGGIEYPVPRAANPFAAADADDAEAWPGGAAEGLADAAELDDEMVLAQAEDELSALADPDAGDDGGDSEHENLPMILLIGEFHEW